MRDPPDPLRARPSDDLPRREPEAGRGSEPSEAPASPPPGAGTHPHSLPHLALTAAASGEALLGVLRQARFPRGRIPCPRCRDPRVQRWGSFSGRRRYRCLGCRRTFSDLTGTPLAYTKRLREWVPFLGCMREAVPVREAALRAGIHRDTAFRWRHRLLAEVCLRVQPRLAGKVGVVETAFRHSEKGSRRIVGRPPRRRGEGRGAGRGWLMAWVLLAGDPGRVPPVPGVTSVRTSLPSRRDVEAILGPVLEAGSTIVVRRGPLSPYGAFCRVHGHRFESTLAPARTAPRTGSGDALIDRLRRHRNELRAWMRRFRGVATRYLAHYVRWHRLVAGELSDGEAWVPQGLLPSPADAAAS